MSDDRDELLARIPVTEVLEELGGPPKARAWPCPSPSHGQSGRTPPVSIDPTGRLWNCHGCGAGGTAIDALVLARDLTVADAFARLRERTGLDRRTHPAPRPQPALVAEPAPPEDAADLLAGFVHDRGWRLEDLYGSTWIAAGAGSVILLWGQAGDPIVDLVHLKQPAEEVGPLKVEHDHIAGLSTITRGFDPLRFLTLRHGAGASTIDVARAMFERTDPTDAQRAKAKRQLERLVREGLAKVVSGGQSGGAGGTSATLYVALDTTHDEAPE